MPRVARTTSPLSPGFRRLILGTALLLALVVALPHKSTPALAQDARPAAPAMPAPPSPPPLPALPKSPDAATTKGRSASISIKPGSIEIKAPDGNDAEADAGATKAPDAAPAGTRTVTIEKGSKRVQITGLGSDREYDSFDQFVNQEPGTAGFVLAIIALVFLSPVLAIALILVYRMRKARMLNETMLKLAEKGVIPPAEALGALTGNTAAALAAGASTAPLYEQAKQIRRRAAWSDLRKGVIMGGIGLGLSVYSILHDRTPHSVGLVLLFVGIGYVVLWWFEQRQIEAKAEAGGGAAPGA